MLFLKMLLSKAGKPGVQAGQVSSLTARRYDHQTSPKPTTVVLTHLSQTVSRSFTFNPIQLPKTLYCTASFFIPPSKVAWAL